MNGEIGRPYLKPEDVDRHVNCAELEVGLGSFANSTFLPSNYFKKQANSLLHSPEMPKALLPMFTETSLQEARVTAGASGITFDDYFLLENDPAVQKRLQEDLLAGELGDKVIAIGTVAHLFWHKPYLNILELYFAGEHVTMAEAKSIKVAGNPKGGLAIMLQLQAIGLVEQKQNGGGIFFAATPYLDSIKGLYKNPATDTSMPLAKTIYIPAE